MATTSMSHDVRVDPLSARYLVIETFRPGSKERIYERFHAEGRLLPDGLRFVASWLERDGPRCFQLMDTDDPALFEVWFARWSDLVSFELVPLVEKPALPSAAPPATDPG